MEEKIAVEDYENIYENKLSNLLKEEELDVEVRRLLKVRKSITKLKATIELSSTTTSKRTNLLIELQSLYEEEKNIISRMDILDSPDGNIYATNSSIGSNGLGNTLLQTSQPQIQNKGVPPKIWNSLLPFQKEGVSWMLNIILKGIGGGILADEMGLGKTVQSIALISALHNLNLLPFKVLIICPATIMEQWSSELTKWYPNLPNTIVHPSHQKRTANPVLITTYGQCLSSTFLNDLKVTLVILDEGHRIRNPETEVSSKLRIWAHNNAQTRIILSGTPIQNNLQELWSLVDFCVPGKLGSLKTFMDELAIPIQRGGLVTSSSLQVETSYRCACTLRSLIDPLIFRRLKADVLKDILPEKSEHVLLCSLTPHQRRLYKEFLQGDVVNQILSGKRNVLAGIDSLRKICNDPRLYNFDGDFDDDYGDYYGDDDAFYSNNNNNNSNSNSNNNNNNSNNKNNNNKNIKNNDDLKDEQSGKLVMLKEILRDWKMAGNRVLLFCQTRQMLNIIEKLIIKLQYPYLRMDGNTPLRVRDSLVEQFNEKCGDDLFIFLLTTKVGGLGINLVGADRIIIYDPDWNPSTDMQARERAWRLGQNRKVVILRFLTRGTIEEKIYHRQIFKQYLTNRILSDPKQGRFFKSIDLYDLFVLDEESNIVVGDGVGLGFGGKDAKVAQTKPTTSPLNRSIISIPHDKQVECLRPERSLLLREAKRRADSALESINNDSLLSLIKRRKEGNFVGAGAGALSDDEFISQCKHSLIGLFSVIEEPTTQQVMDSVQDKFEWTEERKHAFKALLKKLALLKGGKWKRRRRLNT